MGRLLHGRARAFLVTNHELSGSWSLRFRRQVRARSLAATVHAICSMREMNSTFKPTLVLMSGRSLAFAATFFIPMVLVRVFDQTEFGTYKQLFLIVSTLYGIAQLGMAESLL